MHPILLILLAMSALASQTVTVTTDRAAYAPGEEVTIRVSTSGFASNERLWLYVDKPDGHNLHFAELPASGGAVKVTLPIDAPPGFYTVIVTWDHQYIQTGFMVEGQPIPEFPITPMVFIIAFAFATATLARRQASARAETPTTDS
jgi:hypothetical protein